MSERTFALIPFADSHLPDINITGRISRKGNNLGVHYTIIGDIERISFPKLSAQPARKDELWKYTCFEFFIAIPNQPEYWEFNLSASGDWNVYHMDTYRRVGFREEPLIQQLPFSVQKEAGCVSVEAIVALPPAIHTANTIQVGITSIIQTKDGYETYWALTHPNPHADFHLRESFIIEL